MKRYALAISFLLLAATIYFSFYSLMPQDYSDANTPVTEFSTERALIHLEKITKKPHYLGSQEHKNVREYIVRELEKMGLAVEVQDQLIMEEGWKRGTRTQNIIAKIKGSSNGKSLLLLSHYDSAPHSSFGASDDGSGVVTILEGIRAFLTKGEKPNNDIIILISDGEELGLFGASSFVKHHPWAKDVGLVLNFEARGSGGPSYMLIETNGGNKNMIQEFNKANTKFPVATSLAYSIYKMIPNDTDLTVFREDGDIEGFNFAFIDDHFDYHTAQDSFERLDRNTLEHQGTYLMPLLNYFANEDLSNLKSEEDYVYFNFPFLGVIYYPYSWIIPILVVVIVLFLVLLFYGISKQKINLKDVGKGFIPLLISLIVSGVIGYYGWEFLKSIHPQYKDIQHGFTYNGYVYIAAFATLALAICFIVYKKRFKKGQVINLFIAPIIFWVLINIAVIIYLKGAAFFVITLVFSVLVLGVLLFSKLSKESNILLITVLALPVLVVMSPMPKIFPVALGLEMLFVSVIFIVLFFGLLIPIFSNYRTIKFGRLFLVLALALFITASFQSSYNEERKKPNSINYVFDVDKNKAFYTSYSHKIDDFLGQFLGENPPKGHYENDENSWMTYHEKAEIKDIKLPEIKINSDTIIAEERFINFSIIPKRHISRLILSTKDTVGFTRYAINGHQFSKKDDEKEVFRTLNKRRILDYYVSDKDSLINVEFSVNKKEIPTIDLLEISYDFLNDPNATIKPRSESMMPFAFLVNDAIMVKKQIDFDKNIP